MLIIRETHFLEKDGKLYYVGSSNNELYRNNIYQMGKIAVLAWKADLSKYDISKLKEVNVPKEMSIHLHPGNLSFRERVRIIKNEVKECDCVYVKMTLVEAYIGCHYALKYNKPFVIESGTHAWTSLNYHGGSIKYKLAAIPMELLAKYYHWRAKYIIYVSKNYLQDRYPSKAVQIGCPDVVLDNVGEEVLRKRLDKIKSKSKKDRFVLGLIGKTNAEYRGHDTLIEVAANLIHKGYDIEVRFLGGGTSDDKRKKKAELLGVADRVFFDGYLYHQQVLEWLDDLDILVMPTLAETLGRSIIEAMSRGCLVVGSKETAIGEQIGSDCIAPARDVEKISYIIEKMINNSDYGMLCSYENYYRAKKYASEFSNEEKRNFYKRFYKENNIDINY